MATTSMKKNGLRILNQTMKMRFDVFFEVVLLHLKPLDDEVYQLVQAKQEQFIQ